MLATLFLSCIHAAGGNTLTVTSYADNLGNPFTLRTAISKSKDGDTIVFSDALNGFTITLLNGELLITNSLTIIGSADASLPIVGGSVTNSLNKRVFHVTSPAMGTRTVQISGLQLQGSVAGANGTNGNPGSPGGSAGGEPANGGGGAIYCDVNTLLVVSNCYFRGCHAVGGNGGNAYGGNCVPASQGGLGGSACGGAIFSLGDCFLFDSTFYTNTAVGGNGGTGAQGGNGGGAGSGSGGALCIGYHAGNDLKIVNCTFYSNVADGGNGGAGGAGYYCITEALPAKGGVGGKGGDAQGGAIYIDQIDIPATGSIHSTILMNYCSPGTGGTGGAGVFGGNSGANGPAGSASGCGMYLAALPIPVSNTLFAENHGLPNNVLASGPDVFGPVQSQGYNLVGAADNMSGPWINSDLLGTVNNPLKARLGAFQNNGGDMPTIAPQEGSPAIDAGRQGGFPFDQTGQMRPVPVAGIVNGGDGSDIGAFEVQCSTATPLLVITVTGQTLTISWPAPSFCYVLQQSPDLLNWVNSVFPMNMSGAQNQVILNPAPAGPIFFRLIHL